MISYDPVAFCSQHAERTFAKRKKEKKRTTTTGQASWQIGNWALCAVTRTCMGKTKTVDPPIDRELVINRCKHVLVLQMEIDYCTDDGGKRLFLPAQVA